MRASRRRLKMAIDFEGESDEPFDIVAEEESDTEGEPDEPFGDQIESDAEGEPDEQYG